MIEDISRHLMSVEASHTDFAPFLDDLAERLRAAGVPLDRVTTGIYTQHPEIRVVGLRWERSSGARVFELSHAFYLADLERPGPFLHVARIEPVLRVRLAPGAALPYPILERLRDDGFTDYLALRLPGGAPVAYVTRAEGGFTDEALAVLHGVNPALGVALELRSRDHALRSLLRVYLGEDAARRVLAGQVERGTGAVIRAAVWFCDLRGFTELSDAAAPAAVARLLDRVFGGVGAAIEPRGGHILKFIGDAVLAVFPVGDDPKDAAARALGAAHAALAAVDAVSFEGHPVAIGVALHVGEVFYGNVGAERRLDFTVIGAAVNEVCRLEAMCKPLHRALVCSEPFAELLGREGFEALGVHALKGVSRPVAIFAPLSADPRAEPG